MTDRLQGDPKLTVIDASLTATLAFPRGGSFDVTVAAGLMQMDQGFETAVSLSMFGGADQDDGTPGNVFEWWGNLTETEEAFTYRGRTQWALDNLPLTTANLLRVKAAAEADLAWMLALNVANSVDVTVSIVRFGWVQIKVSVKAEGLEEEFTFTPNWKAATP